MPPQAALAPRGHGNMVVPPLSEMAAEAAPPALAQRLAVLLTLTRLIRARRLHTSLREVRRHACRPRLPVAA